MIDPQQLQLLARCMEHYHNMLQAAQKAAPDPKLREELRQLQTFLRDTHAQVQDEMKKFNSTAKAEIEELKQRLQDAEKSIAAAGAERAKQLAELAARNVTFQEIDPLLLEKLQSDLLEDFGNRDRRRRRPHAPAPQSRRSGEVWQDWPETAAPSAPLPKTAASPAEETTLPANVRPFARLIDPQRGEELRRTLLTDFQQVPSPSRTAESQGEVWQDWPEV